MNEPSEDTGVHYFMSRRIRSDQIISYRALTVSRIMNNK